MAAALSAAATADADARLERARTARHTLADGGIHLAGIRHHSPGCARAVASLIEQVRPAVVLIEGPDDLDSLLPSLADPATVPPIALLTLRGEGPGAVSALYPLADFSPEWVALRTAADHGISTHFIDLPWSNRQSEDPQAVEGPETDAAPDGEGDAGEPQPQAVTLLRRTLQSERYFAHSRTLAALATRFGCRDHDDLWDHLFEIRDESKHASMLEDVFVWAALSRLDYESEVLAAEGSLVREHRMLEHIEAWRARVSGPIVVVTGAFHTLALVEALTRAPEGELVRAATPARLAPAAREAAKATDPGWLIRYTLDQFDGLRGYGAGMPSPGFYQRLWNATDRSGVTRDLLQELTTHANATGRLDRISTASLMQAVLQAERLADLRQHPWPGRTDLLDAVTSCLVQTETPPALRESLQRLLGGSALGELPRGVAQPPLVASARRRAEKLRFVVNDAEPRTSSLDIFRSASARERSRFLALMSCVGAGFARMISGPRYAAGSDVHLLREVWEYAWSPRVETQLVSLIEWGSTLEEVATGLLRRRADALSDAEAPPAPHELAALVIDAAQTGLASLIPALLERVRHAMEATSDLNALADSGAVLLRAWNAREHLDLGESAGVILTVIDEALLGSGHRLALLGGCSPEDEAKAVGAIIALRRLVIERGQADGSSTAANVILPTLNRLRTDPATAPGVRGALIALAVADGEIADGELSTALWLAFAPGADPFNGVRLLEGVMLVAPELVVRDRGTLAALDSRVGTLEHEEFMALLPDLRRSFARLRPLDTDRLARHVAEATGMRTLDLLARVDLSEQDLAVGVAVDAQVRESLVEDALLTWAGGSRG